MPGKVKSGKSILENGGTLTREDFKEKDEKLNGKENTENMHSG